jgi:hypothetical protein
MPQSTIYSQLSETERKKFIKDIQRNATKRRKRERIALFGVDVKGTQVKLMSELARERLITAALREQNIKKFNRDWKRELKANG